MCLFYPTVAKCVHAMMALFEEVWPSLYKVNPRDRAFALFGCAMLLIAMFCSTVHQYPFPVVPLILFTQGSLVSQHAAMYKIFGLGQLILEHLMLLLRTSTCFIVFILFKSILRESMGPCDWKDNTYLIVFFFCVHVMENKELYSILCCQSWSTVTHWTTIFVFYFNIWYTSASSHYSTLPAWRGNT